MNTRRIKTDSILKLLMLILTLKQGYAQLCDDTIRIDQEFAQVIVHPGVQTCLECVVNEMTSSTTTWFIDSMDEFSTHGEITNGVLVLYDPATLVRPGNSNNVQGRCRAFGTTLTVFLVSSEFVPPTVLGETAVLEGSEVRLTCFNDNPSLLRVSQVWEDTNGQIVASQTKLVIENVTRNYSGVYRCVLTDMLNNTKNVTTELIVYFRPEVTVLVTSSSTSSPVISTDLLIKDTVQVVCEFSGLPRPSIQWLRDGVLLQDDTKGVSINLKNDNRYVLELANIRDDVIGTYSCLANNSVGQASNDIDIDIQNVLFQLKLFSVSDCDQWTAFNIQSKIIDISMFIVDSIQERCNNCGFLYDQIANEQLQCYSHTPQAVTFRATLYSSTILSAPTLVRFIEEWSAGNVSVTVGEEMLQVDSACRVPIGSYDEQECVLRFNVSTMSSSMDLTVPIAAGVAAGGIVLVVVIVIFLAFLAYYVVKRRHNVLHFEKDPPTTTAHPPTMLPDNIEESLNVQQPTDGKVEYSYITNRRPMFDFVPNHEQPQNNRQENATNLPSSTDTRTTLSSTGSSGSNVAQQTPTNKLNHEYAEPITRHHTSQSVSSIESSDTQHHTTSTTSLLPRSAGGYVNERVADARRVPPITTIDGGSSVRKASVENTEVGERNGASLSVAQHSRKSSNQSDILFPPGSPISPVVAQTTAVFASQQNGKLYETIPNQTAFTPPALSPSASDPSGRNNQQDVPQLSQEVAVGMMGHGPYEQVQTYEKVPSDKHILNQFSETGSNVHVQTERESHP